MENDGWKLEVGEIAQFIHDLKKEPINFKFALFGRNENGYKIRINIPELDLSFNVTYEGETIKAFIEKVRAEGKREYQIMRDNMRSIDQ